MWIIEPREISLEGRRTGRWTLTATSDEGGGGPFADFSHDHANAEEAEACDRCDDYVCGVSGFPTRRQLAESDELRERAEYERLRKKFEGSDAAPPTGLDSQQTGPSGVR